MKMKGKKLMQILSLLCVIFLTTGFANNNESWGNINKISVYPGQLSTNVILETDTPLSVLNSFYSEESPSTIVVDLNNTNAIPESQFAPTQSALVKEIKATKTDTDKARLLIHLKESVPYRIYSDNNRTVIELQKVLKNPDDNTITADIREELEKAGIPTVYLKGIEVSKNNGRIDITAELSRNTLSSTFVLGNPLRLVVDLYNTFNTSQKSVYPVNQAGIKKVRVAQFQISDPCPITRVVFDLDKPGYYTSDFENKTLVLSFPTESASPTAPAVSMPVLPKAKPVLPEAKPTLKPEKELPSKVAPQEKVAEPKPITTESNMSAPNGSQEDQFRPLTISDTEEKYTGEILSLKFKDADLRDVILYLGEFAGLNVVFDPAVSGTVTCNLVDVPWDQALDILLKNNKMGKTIEGNVLRIAPQGVLAREREELERIRRSQELVGPVIVKTFTLSYSRATEIRMLLQSKVSERGEIIVDERTNTLIISDVKDRIDLMERLISVFDTPTPQVSIEARIVEATSTFIRNLGIQWGFKGIADPFYGNATSLQFPNNILVDGALIPQGIVTKGIGGPLGGYAINLPAPAFTSAIGLSFGNVLDTFRLDMALSALETSGQGRIISSPTVTTQNNKEAEIIQGRQIPVQTVANFTVTTRYVNAALELRATPQITAEGTIIMYIQIRNNAADFANLVNGIPPITTQSATTTVMVPDGGTTVIGGIYRTEDSITREKVPLLHKIPILGNLFRSFARTKTSRELLIFITPRIIK
jgi:type IV pilus secretin PilQ/predicted competence protein